MVDGGRNMAMRNDAMRVKGRAEEGRGGIILPLTKKTASIIARVRGRRRGGEGQAGDGHMANDRAATSVICDVCNNAL
jgi:hypothetical protein